MHEFLTTREVAALLRVKERKVYELVAERAIPASRVTGKLLFPRALVQAWVQRHVDYRGDLETLREPPGVVAGSHDPLLEWAIRESGCGLASYFDGSLDGLERVRAGKAAAAGMHVFEPQHEGFNREHVGRHAAGLPLVLIELFRRTQGLVVPAGNPGGIAALADLAGARFVPRQPDSGAHLLLQHLLAQARVPPGAITMLDAPARSEADVALAVADARADAGLAVESAARQYRLGFVPLFQERYDLLVWRRAYFEEPLQQLFGFLRGGAFAQRAAAFGGYDTAGMGRVHLNGA